MPSETRRFDPTYVTGTVASAGGGFDVGEGLVDEVADGDDVAGDVLVGGLVQGG